MCILSVLLILLLFFFQIVVFLWTLNGKSNESCPCPSSELFFSSSSFQKQKQQKVCEKNNVCFVKTIALQVQCQRESSLQNSKNESIQRLKSWRTNMSWEQTRSLYPKGLKKITKKNKWENSKNFSKLCIAFFDVVTIKIRAGTLHCKDAFWWLNKKDLSIGCAMIKLKDFAGVE